MVISGLRQVQARGRATSAGAFPSARNERRPGRVGNHLHRRAIKRFQPFARQNLLHGSLGETFALRDGIVPPTLNLRNLDPEIDLDVVAGEPRSGNYQYAINNSFGFGGHNVALAFGKY